MSDLLIFVLSQVGIAGCFLAWYEVVKVDKRCWYAAPLTLIVYGVLVYFGLLGGGLVMVGLLIIIAKFVILPQVKKDAVNHD